MVGVAGGGHKSDFERKGFTIRDDSVLNKIVSNQFKWIKHFILFFSV